LSKNLVRGKNQEQKKREARCEKREGRSGLTAEVFFTSVVFVVKEPDKRQDSRGKSQESRAKEARSEKREARGEKREGRSGLTAEVFFYLGGLCGQRTW
jgi:hypothetical protein